jgi:ADP-heptose:LPS heptosyltransferase
MNPRREKIIFKCEHAPGDLVVLSAVIRDLHKCYPGRFLTDIRSCKDELFLNNPYLSRLSEDDPEVRIVQVENKYIQHVPHFAGHYIHGCAAEINDALGLNIQVGALKGDIHLSAAEKQLRAVWAVEKPCLQEIKGYLKGRPFWVIAPGWKTDVTIKAWDPINWQTVIDHYFPSIRFIQVGGYGEKCINPPLRNVLNLSGRTDARQLCRLVYLSAGVLCHTSLPMHLAAAFDKPCIVVGGGRENPAWAAYPQHVFLHTIGKLPCCLHGGCWRLYVERSGINQSDNICRLPTQGASHVPQPKCMTLIQPRDVIKSMDMLLSMNEKRTR